MDGFSVWIEHNPGLPAFKLTIYMSQLLLQRELTLTVVRPLAQHKGLHEAAQRIGGQLRVWNEHGFLGFIASVDRRQFLSIPAF